jgi:hypothetical protein
MLYNLSACSHINEQSWHTSIATTATLLKPRVFANVNSAFLGSETSLMGCVGRFEGRVMMEELYDATR